MANTYALFVPECHADTALMLTLLRENSENRDRLRDFISHRQGIGNVGKVMERQPKEGDSARRVLGLVDYDAKFYQQSYLAQFTLHDGGLDRERDTHAILRHPAYRAQFLIALMPACDSWILSRANEVGINLADYKLPTTLREFASHCKTQDAELAGKPLRRLLDAIATSRPPAYAALADFVSQVMDLEKALP